MELDRVETEHLMGYRVQADDLGLLHRMYSNEEVMYTLGGTRLFKETKEFHSLMLEHWEKYDFGIYIFRDKETDEFVGRGGLKKTQIDGKEEVEVLYAVMPRYWGKGFALEMTKKSIEIAFEQLDIDNLICFTSVENKRSLRVMEKAGFQKEKNFTYTNQPHTLYRLKK